METKKTKKIIAAVLAVVLVCGLVIFAYDSGKRAGAGSVSGT